MYVFSFLHLTGSERCQLLVLQVDLKLLLHPNLWVRILKLVHALQLIQQHRHPIQQHRQLILQLKVILM